MELDGSHPEDRFDDIDIKIEAKHLLEAKDARR
jgi:hypothetical protein